MLRKGIMDGLVRIKWAIPELNCKVGHEEEGP